MKNSSNSQNLAHDSPYSQNLRNFTHPLAPSAREGEFPKFTPQNLNAFYVISEYPLKTPKRFSQSALHTQSYGYFYLFESKKIINPQTLKNNANFLLKLQF
ncbi:hypothetical protein ACWIUD_00705 [Helicobacter sp. 23-1044]